METAIFISDIAARKYMGKIPWYRGRRLHIRPCYKRRCFLGYQIVWDGKLLTDNMVEILDGVKA